MPKRKTVFDVPYAGIDTVEGLSILYGQRGDYSVIFQINNPVTRYAADPSAYLGYHGLLLNLVKMAGEGHILQKTDVFHRRKYLPVETTEFLQEKYQQHFAGREYTAVSTYLTLTKQVKKGAFYTFDAKGLHDFRQLTSKARDLFAGAGLQPRLLSEGEIGRLVSRVLSMDFSQGAVCLDNILSGDKEIRIGTRAVRSISLIDIDVIELPETLSVYTERNDKDSLRGFPADNMDFLYQVPGFDTIVYNQLIEIPVQQGTLMKLEQKRKRHSTVPDAANQLCVEDIDRLLEDVARENQLLVNAHFNILVGAGDTKIEKAANFIETALFQRGIVPSRNAYNQLELFRSALPGNGIELKKYDWFLTTSDAALCLWFKESLAGDEQSDFLIRFTDREGIPIGIDLSDLPLRSGRINARNRFVLGASGSGKSFCMNALIEQYCLHNMDVVIVDTGDSYSGLCAYYQGKYIAYTEKNPITMNPFVMERKEFNLEKKDFLKTLIALLWKGVDGQLSQVEDTVISNVLSSYYYEFFWLDEGPQNPDRPQELKFDTFYLYSIGKIREIKRRERIPFDLDEYRYVLKKFCSGGELGTILNEASDRSLFSEKLIVFEIDSIKENKTLLAIVTLVIMDVFIQKMRHRQDRRKALIIEEAWKAITSPIMAGYILYLYKTVRKFWGEAIVVTQELSDILNNAIVKDSIISNSDTVILLDQSRFQDNYDGIAKLLSINEVERRKIFTINKLDNKEGRGRFKEVYIRRGSTGEVYGVEVSLYQYLTYTTEKPEKRAVEAYAAHYNSYRAGLEAFVADMEASGLSLAQFVTEVNAQGVKVKKT